MSSQETLAPRAAPARSWTGPLAIGAILLLALLLRLVHLRSISLWADEFFTLSYPSLGLHYLWGAGLRTEPTSPAYYTLIGALEAMGGVDAAVGRLPSVLASVATVALAWALGRTVLPDRRSAIIGALLLALAPISLLFAQQARAYALQGAAITLALLGLAEFLQGRRRGLLAYAIGGTASLYCHPTSVLALAGLNVAALSAGFGRTPPLRPRDLALWAGTGLLILLACAPLAPIFLSPVAAQAIAWIEPVNRWTVERTMGQVFAGTLAGRNDALLAEIALPLLLALLLLPPWRPGRVALTVLLVPAAVFLVLIVGVSLRRPILLARTVAWVIVPLCLVVADLLRRRGPLVVGAGVGLAAAAAALHLATHAAQFEDWPRILEAVAADPGHDGLIVLAPHTTAGGFRLYAPSLPRPVRLDDGTDVPEVIVIKQADAVPTVTEAAIRDAIAADRRVWLIYRRPEYEWMRRVTASWPAPSHAVQDSDGANPSIRAIAWN